ncbi:MAG TPA: autorepressor SdpR family transcription factor [Steroidobacteraceae bacterium]|nr:autorepressor SdpR family transcription factor [Steroidobacteraceae bacterium]
MGNVFKALADPTRRRILQLLKQRPMNAGDIADHFAISKPTLSAHFTVLREAELIGSERDGKHVIYWLNASVLEEALLSFAGALDLNLKPRRAAMPAGKPAARRS